MPIRFHAVILNEVKGPCISSTPVLKTIGTPTVILLEWGPTSISLEKMAMGDAFCGFRIAIPQA